MAVPRALETAAPCPRPSPPSWTRATSTSLRCFAAIATSKGRVNPQVRANFLASPPLSSRTRLPAASTSTPDGPRRHWEGRTKCTSATCGRRRRRGPRDEALNSEECDEEYVRICQGDELASPRRPPGPIYGWDADRRPTSSGPHFSRTSRCRTPTAISRACACLVKGGRSITTDHISPAGSIQSNAPPASSSWSAGCPGGLQLVRRSSRQPRSDDPRNVRQHPLPQSARAWDRRAWTTHLPSAEKMTSSTLRSGTALKASRWR